MPIVFKTEEERNPISPVLGRIPKNRTTKLVGEQAVAILVEDDLTQSIFDEGQEEKLALEFVMEYNLYHKFMLWCGLQDQLKSLKDSLEIQN